MGLNLCCASFAVHVSLFYFISIVPIAPSALSLRINSENNQWRKPDFVQCFPAMVCDKLIKKQVKHLSCVTHDECIC